MDGVEGVAAGEPGEIPAGGGPTKDGLGGHFILVSDPGARRTNLVEATPIGRGAGKGGQSTKGSQGLSNLVGVDGRLGGDGRVTAVWSRREGRGDPGEAGIAWRRVSWVSPASGILGRAGVVGASVARAMPSDGRHLMHLGCVGLRIGLAILPPTVEEQYEERDDDDHR